MAAHLAGPNKNLCKGCLTMIKCLDGRRTCSCFCAGRQYEFGADPVDKSLTIVDRDDQHIAGVAYIRGLDTHPQRGLASAIGDAIAEMEGAVLLTETPAPPQEESTTDESNSDSDYAAERPEAPPPRGSGINYGFLDDDTSDSEVPEYNAIPGPSHTDENEVPDHNNLPGPSHADNFAAILNAARAAAIASTPGHATREAPPAAAPPANLQFREEDDDLDDAPSPLHTRSGTIRTTPPGRKKRGQRDN